MTITWQHVEKNFPYNFFIAPIIPTRNTGITAHVSIGGLILLIFPMHIHFKEEEDPILVGEGLKKRIWKHVIVIVGYKKVYEMIKWFDFKNYNGPD